MGGIFGDAVIGKKNIITGIVLFLIMGVIVGIPLTVNFLGGSMLSGPQYQTWKVLHGYSVFLAFINFFLGLGIDRFNIAARQKEIVSWTFLVAGLVGGLGRMALALLASLESAGPYASLIETALFVLGTVVLAAGQTRPKQIAH